VPEHPFDAADAGSKAFLEKSEKSFDEKLKLKKSLKHRLHLPVASLEKPKMFVLVIQRLRAQKRKKHPKKTKSIIAP
jgi:hypothetical protein